MRVAFVVQRCGREVNGGAETHCLQVAQRMAKHCRTEVLTTCALDYMSWENFYPPGIEQVGPTVVRRFEVDTPRVVETFNRLSSELHSRQDKTTLAEQEQWMRAQGPVSTPLLNYLREQESSYDAFIFFGYLYAPTYFGLPLVSGKAFLAPLAHDEWPIYFSMWERIFSSARALIFNTPAEHQFLRKRFPSLTLAGPTIGVGIESPGQVHPEDFRTRYGLHEPFLLYLGRIDESKGCAEMIEYFLQARRDGMIKHKLVLAGREVMPVPFHDDIIHLGFLNEEEKWDAMAACDWLLMPSRHESLSMVLLETWSVGRPVLVTGHSPVLSAHCQNSHGGIWYENYKEWCAALSVIDEETKRRLGAQGCAYVKERYSWNRVEADYLDLLSKALP